MHCCKFCAGLYQLDQYSRNKTKQDYQVRIETRFGAADQLSWGKVHLCQTTHNIHAQALQARQPSSETSAIIPPRRIHVRFGNLRDGILSRYSNGYRYGAKMLKCQPRHRHQRVLRLLLESIIPPSLLGQVVFYTCFAVFQALPKCLVPLAFNKTDLFFEVIR